MFRMPAACGKRKDPMKKLLCLLLSMLMLPLGMLIPSDASTAETVPDIWALIERFEDARFAEAQLAAKDATARDYAALSNGIANVVTGTGHLHSVEGGVLAHPSRQRTRGISAAAIGNSLVYAGNILTLVIIEGGHAPI